MKQYRVSIPDELADIIDGEAFLLGMAPNAFVQVILFDYMQNQVDEELPVTLLDDKKVIGDKEFHHVEVKEKIKKKNIGGGF